MAMKIVKLLMNIYMVLACLFFLVPLIVFINAASSIAGVVLFVYLWRTRQLAFSKKIFFLIPHVVFFGIAEVDYGILKESYFLLFYEKQAWPPVGVYSVFYLIVAFGLPFLLYCFLHVTGKTYVIIARILCVALPLLTIFVYILSSARLGI